MGRKIPAKKHHGVKDPEKQAERRNAKIKLKINEAPANIDDQEIPKKLKNLFERKKFKKMKLIDDEPAPVTKAGKPEANPFKPQRPIKKIPKFERYPGESDRDFLWRTEVTTRDYLKKARFEDKYDVDVETNEKTGETNIKKRDKNLKFLEDGVKIEPKNKWEKKKLKKLEKLQQEREERKKLKKEKFKMRKLFKKNKRLKQDDFSVLKQDKVEFGDVAERPPTLTAKPRKSNAMLNPGNRDLLLKNMEQNDKPSSNLSGKRKDLSALDRVKLEEERQRVVDLYRKMQALKNANRA
ncbi:hypothetical protein GHT06_011065 [Daphnia sinensis]|uniref:Coiled-coil domain-containing protein 137 n=1 Tax=Daphnia sinensis TaxID=1820382 RepID=A0AAD5KZG5_9CRUS|nr:hypothetical protein GHT06_011065 [Daphnia sinensis]